jgi:hypothetical protein
MVKTKTTITIARRPADSMPDCLSVAEFCRRNSLSVQYFYKCPDQMPDSFRLGARRLITREAADRWRMARDAQAADDNKHLRKRA